MKKVNVEEIIKLREKELTYSQISKILKISKGTVSKYCRGINENLSIYKKIIKIDKDIIEKAQKYYDSGLTLREVSKIIGIHRTTLSKYLKIRKRPSRDKEETRMIIIEKVKRWKRKLKKDLVEIKGGKCMICGYDKSLRSLHFHHIDPNKKDINISSNSMTKQKAIEELEKCVLVCSNCHGEIHDEIFEKGYSDIINNLLTK